MKIETLTVDFTDEQKRYLEGFTTGLQISRVGRGLGGASAGKANAEPAGPDAAHIKAQDKVTASGKKLADQEKFKREEHPFDAYPRLKQQALDNAPPNPADNFRWRYYGLFYVAPAQDSYMCRLRIPNGILKHWQFAGLADLAEKLCGPFCHVTTRANLQVREIPPKNAVALIEGIQDLGLCSRGTGADNIRNVTGTPTAGIDPQELLDTREYAREWHYHILNDRSLYGLPRKFNVAFDGAGKIAVLEDTNDIAFSAVEVKDGFGVEPGVWFRLGLGGITGHRDFAKYGDIIVKPADATKVSDAIVRIFIDLGDRTNRNKARLKYVLDGMGHDKFLALVEERLGKPFTRVPPEALAPRPAFDRMAHIGVHKQKQEGLNWIGVSLPLGKVTCDQMRGLAKIAQDLGDGDIRLTVWQNLLIPGVRDENVELGDCRDQEDRARGRSLANPRRADRLHRQCRLPVCGVEYQASCRRDRRLVRAARQHRHAAQHPRHRLPSFLRAALHQRYRADRGEGGCRRGCRSGRGLSLVHRRRLWSGCRCRAGGLSRPQGGRRAEDGREIAEGLSRASRFARRNLPDICAPP